jgi:divalent metal cation (Fe/Co/Zn/Cd) transporter
VYIVYESGRTLWLRERPERTAIGVVILALSVVVMPTLARAKRAIASALKSRALTSEAKQTSLCGYLSGISLGGVVLNALFGWWWADPLAALAMVPIILLEGVEGIRGRDSDCDCH